MTHTDVLFHRSPSLGDGQKAIVAAIRRDWSAAYQIDIDGNGIWWALRRDGRKAVSGRTPLQLLVNIIADFDARPVTGLDQIPRLDRLRAEHPEVIILRTGPVPVAWLGLEKITGASLAEMLDKLEAALKRAAPGTPTSPDAPAGGETPGAAPPVSA